MSRKNIFTIFVSVFLFIFAATNASAATFTVINTNDENDLTLGDGICAAASGCTLRAAVQESNALGGDDAIVFDSSLLTANQTITLNTSFGEIVVTSNITLTWNGFTNNRSLTISGNDANRIFNVTVGLFTINNISITNGESADNGGAISITGGANVTLNNSLVANSISEFDSNNGPGGGGGIYVSGATLSLNNSVIDNNTAAQGDGGGIWATGSTVTITNSNITSNDGPESQSDGGGIFVGSGTTLTINNSNLSNNTVGTGFGQVGGAIDVNASPGGATVRIDNSTFNGNVAGRGGAIYFEPGIGSGSLNISNSTFALNTAGQEGGGLLHGDGTVTIRNSTFANNSGGTRGGGVARVSGTLNLANNIIANNTASTDPDIFVNSAFTSLGGNLVRNRGTSVGYIGTDLPDGTNPNLGTFGFNGGRTRTFTLLAGSPAINAGINAEALDSNGVLLVFDQRGTGFNRIVNVTVDIGSYEFGNAAPTSAFVLVAGRVTTAGGRGIGYARVLVTDSTSGETRTVITNPFGYYRFSDVRAGSSYLFEVKHKRYVFAPQVVTVNSAIEDLNFIAQ